MTTYTAENWPIACPMLLFGNLDSKGGPIQDADPEEWNKQMAEVAFEGFTEMDPLDVWETAQLLDKGLSMPILRRRLLAVQAKEIVMENTSFKWLLRQIQNLRRVEKAKEEKAAPADTALKLPSWIRQI